MPTPENDPRVFFAAERTLLAWIRTGIASIGVGFVVARFGLLLRMMHSGGDAPPSHPVGSVLGVTFVALGSATMLLAALQHRRYIATLREHERPPHYSATLSLAFSFTAASLSGLLASYLLWQLLNA